MADLSELLGDVYGPARAPATVADAPTASAMPIDPAWADDECDAAFASRVPGASVEVPGAGREAFPPAPARPPGSPGPRPIDDDLASALADALATPTALAATLAGRSAPSARRRDETPVDALEHLEHLEHLEIAERLDSATVLMPPASSVDAPAGAAARVAPSASRYFASVDVPDAPDTAPVQVTWQRSDDDILPVTDATRSRTRRGLRFR